MVRRNNFILGSGRRRVKPILLHCTSRVRRARSICVKCNRMKHLQCQRPCDHRTCTDID